MLHTGTMFAVIAYFWKQWRGTYFSSAAAFKAIAGRLVVRDRCHRDRRRDHRQDHGENRAPRRAARRDRGSVQPPGIHCAGSGGRRLADSGRGAARDAACAAPSAPSRASSASRRRHHRVRAGVVPALPRLLALRRHHLDRHADRRLEAARRALQLRARRGAHAAGRGSRGAAPGACAAGSPRPKQACSRSRS